MKFLVRIQPVVQNSIDDQVHVIAVEKLEPKNAAFENPKCDSRAIHFGLRAQFKQHRFQSLANLLHERIVIEAAFAFC